MLVAAGITRCADITGLDRVGIPVTLAVRPNARLIVGATGKGTSLVHAQVSGLMEALEVHHAEYAEDGDVGLVQCSYEQLAGDGAAVVEPGMLPVARHGTFDRSWIISWTWGFDLVRQVETPVPFLYVHMARDFLSPEIARMPFAQFIAGSNGLASGNTPAEAVTAALYEVIERDCTAVWEAAVRDGAKAPVVDLDHTDSTPVAELVQRCRQAGLELIVNDNTTDLGVPTYSAVLLERRSHGFDLPAGGWGTHLDPEVALIRAITEAAQSRVVVIAGSRDDVFAADRNLRSPAWDPAPGPRAEQRQSCATDTFEGDLRRLIDRLGAQGLDRVIVTDLRQPTFGLDVVKVWVPGLEEYSRVSQYQPGRRAAEWRLHTSGQGSP